METTKDIFKTTGNERFIVKDVIKFGMLFGYVVFDSLLKENTPYEYTEDEKLKAEARAGLSNAFNDLSKK